MTIALIDGDIFTYKIGFACQTYKYYLWDMAEQVPVAVTEDKQTVRQWSVDYPDRVIEKIVEPDPISKAIKLTKSQIDRAVVGSKADSYKVYLTGKDNFRDNIATILKYKGNRDGSRRPHHYQNIRDYLVNSHKATVVHGMEADDALAMAQCRLYKDSGLFGADLLYKDKHAHSEPVGAPSVICSIDKDLDMVQGWHYNADKDQLYHTDNLTGWRLFYEQVLKGDGVDNIAGLHGIGNKTATKILAACQSREELHQKCLDFYESYFSFYTKPITYQHWNGEDVVEATPAEIMRENARLLWMRKN